MNIMNRFSTIIHTLSLLLMALNYVNLHGCVVNILPIREVRIRLLLISDPDVYGTMWGLRRTEHFHCYSNFERFAFFFRLAELEHRTVFLIMEFW